MTNGENVDLIFRFTVQGRSFRVHFNGQPIDIELLVRTLQQLAPTRATETEFLEDVYRESGVRAVTVGDVLDMIHPTAVPAVDHDSLSILKDIARTQSTERAWSRIKALVLGSDDEDLRSLIANTAAIAFSRSYIASVLDGLDERAEGARRELRDGLPSGYSYLLVD